MNIKTLAVGFALLTLALSTKEAWAPLVSGRTEYGGAGGCETETQLRDSSAFLSRTDQTVAEPGHTNCALCTRHDGHSYLETMTWLDMCVYVFIGSLQGIAVLGSFLAPPMGLAWLYMNIDAGELAEWLWCIWIR